MTPNYLELSSAQTREFEGSVPWLYRDTSGNVTVGVGLMLPDLASALALGFAVYGEPATPEQITADWERVTGMAYGPNCGAAIYAVPGNVTLPDATIDALLLDTLTGIDTTLRERFTGWDGFPNPAKLAMLDMAFNLGRAGLLNGYPRLCAAVDAGHWQIAAMECFRNGISPERNAWCKQQFLSC